MTPFVPPPSLAPLLAAVARLAAARAIDAYIVGGTVRDVLLARDTRDLDLAVARDAIPFARDLAAQLGAHFVLLDDEHAVARVVLPRGAGAAARSIDYIDVAQLQGGIEDDMRRRDFTVDALAVRIGASAVIDVCGGIADLDRRRVRMTSASVLDADPLRLLRGPRIASELTFRLDPATARAIAARAPLLRRAAAERRRDELARMLALDHAHGAMRLLDRLHVLDVLLPELAAGRGVSQPGEFHAYDVFEHNLRALEAIDIMLAPPAPGSRRRWLAGVLWQTFAWCEPSLRAYLREEPSEGRSRAALLKLATLLHDVAKPQTRAEDAAGRVRFFGHADEGAAVASRIMRRLRFSARELTFVSTLVAEHLRPVQLAQVGEAPTRRALYRFFRDLGEAAPAVLLLALADAAAARGPKMTRASWSRQAAYMNSLLVRSSEEEGIVNPPRLLNGHDIMSLLDTPAGPQVGRLLEALREAQAVGEVHSRDEALAYVRALAKEGPGAP